MKRAIALVVSVIFILSFVGFASATKDKECKKEKMYITGEVTAVDATAKTLTIKGEKGEVALTTSDKTRFAKGKSLADIKVGDKMTAKYSEKDGKMMAWKVMTKEEMEQWKKERKGKRKEKAED